MKKLLFSGFIVVAFVFVSVQAALAVGYGGGTDKAITGFTITGQVGTTTISESAYTINLVMPSGTNASALTPTITINGFSIIPDTGVENDFTSTTTYTVYAEDASTQEYVVTVQVLEATQTAPDADGEATISTSTPEVVITSPTATTTLTINSDVSNPTIDISSLISVVGTTTTGTLPAIIIDSPIADVTIPASTVVTSASTTWNGVIQAPTVTTVTLPNPSGETRTLSTAIELGFSGEELTFDKAVKIVLPDQADKRVGWTRNAGTDFTEITTTCTTNSQAGADAQLVGGVVDCKKTVGSDLVIWTKHFTTFASYSQSTNAAVSSGGGGWLAPVFPKPVATTTVAAVTTNVVTPTAGFKFVSDLKVGSEGAEVTELQKVLVAGGYLVMPKGVAYGYYGNATKLAVMKYQKAKGISQVGTVGPITRKALNSSSTTAMPTQNIASMTLKELVQMLLQIGAIAADKIDAANKLINSL